jgi:hypothetical protein
MTLVEMHYDDECFDMVDLECCVECHNVQIIGSLL